MDRRSASTIREKSAQQSAAKRAVKSVPARTKAAAPILRIRAELLYVEPAIWRSVDVPASMTLTSLHRVLQVLMDWQEYHLWAFEKDERRFTAPEFELGFDEPGEASADPAMTLIGEVMPRKDERLLYNYDFGDDWWIAMVCEAIVEAEPGVRYPRCTAGERAGPPEDCGGPPGLDDLISARKRPKSREAQELLEWVGPDWDPEEFNIDVTNKALAAIRPARASRRRS